MYDLSTRIFITVSQNSFNEILNSFNIEQEDYNVDHSHLDHPEECMEDPFQEAIDMFIKIFINKLNIEDSF